MSAPRPYTLIAEITYRCPLHCVYCSNPVDYRAHATEMDTAAWLRVLDDAAALGVLQVHFTGGEPLARDDLEALVERAHEKKLYSNLITSGVPLDRARLERLRDAGLDAVQVSFQGASEESSRAFADYDAFEKKLEVARLVRELDLPLTINVVLHRGNIDDTAKIIALAERLDADRLELANVQLQGFALENRDALLPTRDQLDRALAVATAAKTRLAGRIDVLFVKPDYFSQTPRACMDGWGRRFVQVLPDGTVVPCHAAVSITSLAFERIADRPLAEIWEDSPAMNAFRGEAWMPQPCRSCEKRAVDFGGCRCQAFALLGDASLTDPACTLSPRHDVIASARAREPERRFLFRGR
jgi:pyrroloquinoline quinone biosynthesis protein E